MERMWLRDAFAASPAADDRERRACRRRQRVLLGCIGLMVLLVVATVVGRMVVMALTAPPPPTSLHVIRIAGPAQAVGSSVYVIQPLDRTLSDLGTVQSLYSTVLGLPQALLVGSCKPDVEEYVLIFSRGTTVVLTAWAHTEDCGNVLLDRGNPNDQPDFTKREGTPAFWSALAQALGISVQQLYPIPVNTATPSPTTS